MAREIPDDVPYCGAAPLPAEWLGQWNTDPLLVFALAAASLVMLRGEGKAWRMAGMLVLAVAFVSPLCALASALFSARVLHHVLIVAVAAPLIAAGIRWRPRNIGVAFAAHTVLLWLWHAPQPYALALSSDTAYWLMEATLFGSAIWLWCAIMAPGRGAVVALATLAQMGLLGALLTFAGRPLYAAHALTTAPWGLSPLEDQQLAGLLMWVPAAVPYFGYALARVVTDLLPARHA